MVSTTTHTLFTLATDIDREECEVDGDGQSHWWTRASICDESGCEVDALALPAVADTAAWEAAADGAILDAGWRRFGSWSDDGASEYSVRVTRR